MECINSLSETAHGESIILSRSQGYDYEFVPPLDQKYECPICLLALRAPMQTTCGHRFCRECIYSSLSLSDMGRCPIDNTPLKESDLFPDSCAEREVLQLKVRCPNTSLGCSQVVDLMYIEHHTHACSFQPVLCPNECSATVLQRELEEHLTAQCLLRQKLCSLCHEPYPFNQEQLHQAMCTQATVTCELCSREVVRSDLSVHMSDSCPRVVVSCPYTEHGCFHKTLRTELDAHLRDYTQHHLHLLSSAQKRVTALVWELSRSTGMSVWAQSPNSTGFSRQPSLRSQLSAYSPTPERPNAEASGDRAPIFSSPPLKLDTNATSTPTSTTQASSKLHLPFSQLNIGAEGIDEAKTWDDTCKGEAAGKSLTLPQQEAILRDLCEKRLEVSQGLLQVNIRLANQQRQIEELETRLEAEIGEIALGKFCNGEYVWRITDFPRVVADLRDGSIRVLHSPGFHTSPFGYKFCLRINLTQGTDGGTEWLSLFIHGMRGDSDHFLDWPFAGTITFTILDCGNVKTKTHITETLQSSPDRQAFSRPQAHRNPKGFGYTEFVPLSKVLDGGLENSDSSTGSVYMHDGTVFIKATVKLLHCQEKIEANMTACICQHQVKSHKI